MKRFGRWLLFSSKLRPGWEHYVLKQTGLLIALAIIVNLIGDWIFVGADVKTLSLDEEIAEHMRIPLLLFLAVMLWFFLREKYGIYSSFAIGWGVCMPAGFVLVPMDFFGTATFSFLGFWVALRGYSCGPART